MGSKLTSRLPPILRSYYIVSFQGGWYLIIPRFFCWKNAYPFLPYDDHKTTHLGPPGTSSSSSSRRGEVAVLLEMTDIGDIKDVKKLFTNIFSDSLKGLGATILGMIVDKPDLLNRVCQWWYHPITSAGVVSKSSTLALNQQPPSHVVQR